MYRVVQKYNTENITLELTPGEKTQEPATWGEKGQAENSKRVSPKIAKFSAYSRNKISPALWLGAREGGE